MIDLDSVVVLNNSSIVQFLMNLVLSERMLDIVIFNLIAPTVVKMMDFASNLSAIL